MECGCRRISATITRGSTIGARLSSAGTVTGTLAARGASSPPYQGPYDVTPSETAQVLPTESKRMIEDLVVNPIPSNYGLIGWDGATLHVS